MILPAGKKEHNKEKLSGEIAGWHISLKASAATRRMRILLIVVLLASMASFPVGVRNKQKSNILWIITDEHNFNTLGCFRELLSPNQAENGAVANRMDSSSPVFSPCRFESTLNPLALNDVKKCFLILWEDGLCVNVKFISKFQHQ